MSHTLDLPLAAEAFVEAHPSIFGDELSPTDAAYSFQQTILLPDWLHAQPVPYGKERGRTERAKIENLTNIVASVDLPVEGTPGLVLEVADSIVVPGERGLFVRKRPQVGTLQLDLGDRVGWAHSDEQIPYGAVGVVTVRGWGGGGLGWGRVGVGAVREWGVAEDKKNQGGVILTPLNTPTRASTRKTTRKWS